MADRRDDESNWVSTEASIRFTHKVGSNKALTNFSNFCDRLGNFPVTIKEEANNDEAVSVCMHQQSYDDPSILRTYSINKTRDGQLVTITERVPPLAFHEWLNKPRFKQWEMSLDGISLLGLADGVRQVLKQVGDCLKKMMFTRNQCHGRREEGIRISSNGDVKVMMMTPRHDNLTNFEFEEGLKKDIGQFRNLIEKIENVRPLNGPQPSALVLFYQLCDRAQRLSGKALRDMAYFIYGNAAFFSDEEKLKLFYKLKDFLDANVTMTGRLLNFNNEPVHMRNWGQEILQLPRFSPWRVGYENEKTTYQYEAHGIFIYHKNTLSHFSDNDFKSETRQRRLATMKQLSQVFPEFIPKLFFLAATEVRENEDKFGVTDSKTGTIVGGDLVIFLRTGRDALP